jgi:hypothetical protein
MSANISSYFLVLMWGCGGAVVKALRYKPEGPDGVGFFH